MLTKPRVGLACGTLWGAMALAGPITPPPGPVASTHKTLSEIEPRIAINLANTPGDADSLYKITQSGSYYLTGNITGVVGEHGIEIAADHVTIDLMGFALRGVPGSLNGITTEGQHAQITVRNGMVTAWGAHGIGLAEVTIGDGDGSLIEGVTASLNGDRGIFVGEGCVVRACVARLNTGNGIHTYTNAAIESCSAHENGFHGIVGGSGSTVTNCTAKDNASHGIIVSSGLVHASAAYSNGSNGVSASGTASNCVSNFNGIHGISMTGAGLAIGNTCQGNGTDTTAGAGIAATSQRVRIEGNNCVSNDIGIDVNTTRCVIVRNTCSNNTTNWSINANNIYGTIVDRSAATTPAVEGNSASDAMGSTNAHANFTY